MESALQPKEKSKDGTKVIKVMYTQHACLTLPWASSRHVMSLTDQIAKFPSVVIDITIGCCKHTGSTPPTEHEFVLLIVDSTTFTDPTLTTNIVMVTSDLTRLWGAFGVYCHLFDIG